MSSATRRTLCHLQSQNPWTSPCFPNPLDSRFKNRWSQCSSMKRVFVTLLIKRDTHILAFEANANKETGTQQRTGAWCFGRKSFFKQRQSRVQISQNVSKTMNVTFSLSCHNWHKCRTWKMTSKRQIICWKQINFSFTVGHSFIAWSSTKGSVNWALWVIFHKENCCPKGRKGNPQSCQLDKSSKSNFTKVWQLIKRIIVAEIVTWMSMLITEGQNSDWNTSSTGEGTTATGKFCGNKKVWEAFSFFRNVSVKSIVISQFLAAPRHFTLYWQHSAAVAFNNKAGLRNRTFDSRACNCAIFTLTNSRTTPRSLFFGRKVFATFVRKRSGRILKVSKKLKRK